MPAGKASFYDPELFQLALRNLLRNKSFAALIIAGPGMFLVTLITVSYQSLKAAMMNPVMSLRAE